MRVLGALLLLIGLALGFSPRTASASPCPRHLQAHEAATVAVDDGGAGHVVLASAEVVAKVAPDLAEAPSPEPLFGHVMPNRQPCCHHAAPAAAPAYGPAVGPHARTGRRVALRSFLPAPPSLAFGIYRPPATT